jgi:hypothetical protein
VLKSMTLIDRHSSSAVIGRQMMDGEAKPAGLTDTRCLKLPGQWRIRVPAGPQLWFMTTG